MLPHPSRLTPEVIALAVSKRKGSKKSPVPEITLRKGCGVLGDAHAGPGIRQVSLLAQESIDKMRRKGLKVGPGDFAENITTSRLDLPSLPLGTRLRLGKTALLQITQIGKECHSPCQIFYSAGDCVMPREGVFAIVLRGGRLRPGDPIKQVGPTRRSAPTNMNVGADGLVRPQHVRQKPLRLPEAAYDDPSSVYFLTLCSAGQKPAFSDSRLAGKVVEALHLERRRRRVSLYCYCLMPDHLHLVLSPGQGVSVSTIVQRLKTITARAARSLGVQDKLWQRGFYDHIARKEEDVLGMCQYVLDNPVRAGLVSNYDKYPFSALVDPI